jgi:nitrate reductase cytochrome c-type subunit
MKKTLFVLLSITLSLSCSSGGPSAAPEEAIQPAPAAAAATPDSEIGLAAGTAFEQPPQEAIGFNSVDPGESELRARPNGEFPPAIPHTVEDLETITLEENACLECHDVMVAADMGAVAVPSSHNVDLRRKPEAKGDEVVGARWVCTSCHVAQTDAKPLVAISSG